MIASNVVPLIPQTSYILISPLLTPITSFTSFFTSSSDKSILSTRSERTHSDSVQKILVIYGVGDTFALSTGRYRRHFAHVKQHWGNKLQVKEIDDGGHFWFDIRSRTTLLETIAVFIQT
jgi:hypothetical protein